MAVPLSALKSEPEVAVPLTVYCTVTSYGAMAAPVSCMLKAPLVAGSAASAVFTTVTFRAGAGSPGMFTCAEGVTVKPAAMPEDVDLREINAEGGTLVLRRSTAKGPLPHRLDLIPAKPIANGALRAAVAAGTEDILGDTGQARAVEQLLTR